MCGGYPFSGAPSAAFRTAAAILLPGMGAITGASRTPMRARSCRNACLPLSKRGKDWLAVANDHL
eukprot:1084246-Pyramimonas_sp.AAC.1